jgi:hypothetical protein
MEQSLSLEAFSRSLRHLVNSSTFMEPEGLLLYSQEPTTGIRLEQVETSPHLNILFL